MTRLRLTLSPWLLAATLAGVALAGAPAAHADGGWWGDLDKGQGVRLADVIENPERHRGRSLTFVCVFHQQEREFNPLRTRFNAERFDNVSVWPDGAALWLQKEFERDFPFLYVSRSHPQRDALLRLEMYTRIEVTARVEVVLDGAPFLELTGVRVTGHKLGAHVMRSMMAGEVYGRSLAAEQQTLAAERFEAALGLLPDLAPPYALRIRERLAQSYRALGRTADAERVVAGGAVSGGAEPPAGQPGEPAQAPVPEALLGPSMPGVPYQMPAPSSSSPEAPRPRSEAPRPPAPTRPGPPPPPTEFVAPTLPGTEVGPGEAFKPSLPGEPVYDAPPTPRPPTPRPPAPLSLPAPPTAVAAPKIIDPPLPSAPAGGAPPPRRPRLAGVK